MASDIFDYWADVPGEAHWHPDDEKVLHRAQNRFELGALPAFCKGPLKTAPVVLLALSPGFRETDLDHASSPEGQAYYAHQRTGGADLPTAQEHGPLVNWTRGILRQFGIEYDNVRSRVAVLNAGAYKSKEFKDHHMLTALPSSRVVLSWAQEVLFQQAERGERVVVCLRARRTWGLKEGVSFGSLHAPATNRAATMLHGEERERIAAAVKDALSC
ncbi:hypothetical protein [Hansschlegelia sp.]|uniref:hypothetical protein n=1 Tax=Hansschlegelia sp. TaxID=2041892 RepID=UPI002BF146D9|nr:hypothetical protein [Hansschlegelia sp.]HVI30177.1 hypothetical protein [Hansschlegelia sp.]